MAHPDSDAGSEDLTQLLREASRGNKAAFDRMLPLVYEQLKALAKNRLSVERDGHTLNTTALVHETYLKLVNQERVEWQSRSHFYAVAAQAMRRILVDHARARTTSKRGQVAPHVSLDIADLDVGSDAFSLDDHAAELVALNDALDRLAEFNPRGAQVVEARFFGGLSYREIAEVFGTSEITVRRAWTVSKAWLGQRLQ